MRVKSFLLNLVVFVLLLLPPISQSQESTPSPQQDSQNRQEIRESRPGGGPNLEENLLKRRENIINRQKIREERQARFNEMKKKFQAAREDFRTKLQTIKDERKKLVVERLDGRLTIMNKNQTDRMRERLDRLTNIANRLQQQLADFTSAGRDTVLAQSLLTEAQKAIDASETAVATQGAKEYIIAVPEETGLKNSVGETVSQLRGDLEATHKTVIEAKQALVRAHEAIKLLGKVNISE